MWDSSSRHQWGEIFGLLLLINNWEPIVKPLLNSSPEVTQEIPINFLPGPELKAGLALPWDQLSQLPQVAGLCGGGGGIPGCFLASTAPASEEGRRGQRGTVEGGGC